MENKNRRRNIKTGLYRSIYTLGYLIAVFSIFFFIECNSHNTDKQVNRAVADTGAFETFMNKFPKVSLPVNYLLDNSAGKDTIEYADAVKFLCQGNIKWSKDPYFPQYHPDFFIEKRLPNDGNLKLLIYGRFIGDIADNNHSAYYTILSTFLADGKMCDKLVIAEAGPVAYSECTIDCAYNIHVSRIIFRDTPEKAICKDTMLCKVIHGNYIINPKGEFIKLGESVTHEKYYFDPNNEGQFTKLQRDSAIKR